MGSINPLLNALKSLVKGQLSPPLIRALPPVLAYSDVLVDTLHAFRGLLKAESLPSSSLENIFIILRSMPMPSENIEALITSQPQQAIRKAHERTWRSLLAQHLSEDLHVAALEALPTHLLPFCSQPLKLLDFLAASADRGGQGTLFALQALSTLMAAHALYAIYIFIYPL